MERENYYRNDYYWKKNKERKKNLMETYRELLVFEAPVGLERHEKHHGGSWLGEERRGKWSEKRKAKRKGRKETISPNISYTLINNKRDMPRKEET